jgi:hypothetical protein
MSVPFRRETTSRAILQGVLTALVSCSLVLAVLSEVCAQGAPRRDGGWKPTATEVAQLPKYCWAQFTKVKGPEYELPKGCGGGMNHYCPALVEYMRASRSYSDRQERLGHLNRARRNVLYTLRAMERYPACPLRADVETTLKIVDAQWRGAGGK